MPINRDLVALKSVRLANSWACSTQASSACGVAARRHYWKPPRTKTLPREAVWVYKANGIEIKKEIPDQ